MFKRLSFITVLAALVLAACAPAAAPAPSVAPDLEISKQEVAGFAGGGAATGTSNSYAAADGVAPAAALRPSASAPASDRLVIKNVNLSLLVKDPAAASDSLAALAQSLGGFVVTSNTSVASSDAAGNKYMQATIAVRVPAEKLDDALAQIKKLAVNGQAESETISGEDVTAQYTDLQSQLRNLEAAEAQLQKIMEQAVKTEDVLNVFNQLTSIRGQIEQIKGQMKYYQEAAAMSLVTVSLMPDALSRPIEVGGWRPEGVAKDALEALVSALQDLASALIWLGIYILPLGLLCGIPVLLVGRFGWRRLRRPKAAAQTPPAPKA